MELLAQLQEWSLDVEIERQHHEINKQLKLLRAGAAVAQAAHNHPVPGSTPGPATNLSAALKPWPASPITYPTGAVDGAADTPLRRGQPGPAGFRPSSPEADTVNMDNADQAPAAAGDTYDKVHVFPKGRWS